MITVDTNIYISAFEFGRKPMELLEMAAREEIEIAVSQAIIDETLGVLRDKFAFSRERLDETRAVIEACTTMVAPTTKLNVIPEDESDNRILECAIRKWIGLHNYKRQRPAATFDVSESTDRHTSGISRRSQR